MLVISAIPDLVDTWTSGFGFGPIDDKEKEQLNNINLMVFPGTTLLKKRLNGMERIKTKQTGEQFPISLAGLLYFEFYLKNISGSNPRNAGLDNELSPRAGISREDVCSERNSLVHGILSARNTGIVGFDLALAENPLLQNCRNLQMEVQPDGQLKRSPETSCREPFLTTNAGGECEVFSSDNCCSVNEGIECLDRCDANQLVLTKPVVSNEMLVANAASVLSSNSPVGELCCAYICSLSIAEANSDGGLVNGPVDAGDVCHSAVAFRKDEMAKLITQHQEAAGAEENQPELSSTLGWSSESVNSLQASAGVNGKVDSSHCRKLNGIYALREHLSLPQGTSVGLLEVATTTGGTNAILSSHTGSADAHSESCHSRSIQGICKKHSEDRSMSCLLKDAHEQHCDAFVPDPRELCSEVGKESLKPSSHGLTKEIEEIHENK